MTTATLADAYARALFARHRPTFAPEARWPLTTSAAPSQHPVYASAWHACLALGFIDVDAHCLARAFQRRAERTGVEQDLDWPDQPEDFGMDPAPAGTQERDFAACPSALGLYVVAPSADWVGQLARLGVPTVQLRFKSPDTQAVRAEVRAAIAAVQGTEARLFINDHWECAIEEGAWGVHLGQEDLDAADLHALRRAGLRLGVSTHGYAEMALADRVRPSYIAMGAVYPTTLKAMATEPQGVARLHAYARLMQRYPLVAIGGIDLARLPEVLARPDGAHLGSVAVVRAVVGADDPAAAVAAFQAALAAAHGPAAV